MLPNTIPSGTTFGFMLDLPDYPSPDWSASLILRGPSQIDIAAVGSGTQHQFTQPAQVTAQWSPGRYQYCIRLTRTEAQTNIDEVIQIEEGYLQILPNLSIITTSVDARTHVQKVLDAIEAVIEGRATKDQQSYTIHNRQLNRTPIADLLKLRDRYKDELRRQNAAKKIGNSLLGRPVYVRFNS